MDLKGELMGKPRPWEIAAAAVEFPVVAVAEGVDDLPRLSQWGGDPERPPNSVTLEYGFCGTQVTTYPERLWGEGESWKDLGDFVASSYGWAWEARNGPPLNFEGREVLETTRTPTEKGYLEVRSYKSLPEEEAAGRSRRKQAASEAERRVIELPLDGSLVRTKVVGGDDLWAAGFESVVNDALLVALLSGTDVSPESLKLKLVNDLLALCSATT